MKKILAMSIFAAVTLQCVAKDFFDTSEAERTIDFGARIGINTSNRTISDKAFPVYNRNNWGTGFSAGFVCNLNFRDYLTIQPGIFYDYHSGTYSYVDEWSVSPNNYTVLLGKMRSYNISIPVVASIRFNVTDNVRWSVDAGPYFRLRMSPSSAHVFIQNGGHEGTNPTYDKINERTCDFGLKFGTGVQVLGHYYFGIHYQASFISPWAIKGYGGHSKAWTFMLGYDF